MSHLPTTVSAGGQVCITSLLQYQQVGRCVSLRHHIFFYCKPEASYITYPSYSELSYTALFWNSLYMVCLTSFPLLSSLPYPLLSSSLTLPSACPISLLHPASTLSSSCLHPQAKPQFEGQRYGLTQGASLQGL